VGTSNKLKTSYKKWSITEKDNPNSIILPKTGGSVGKLFRNPSSTFHTDTEVGLNRGKKRNLNNF